MILCIQNKPGTFTRQDPSPPLRFPFSRAPYSSSQLPIAAPAYARTHIYTRIRNERPLHVPNARAHAIQTTRVSFAMPMAGKNE